MTRKDFENLACAIRRAQPIQSPEMRAWIIALAKELDGEEGFGGFNSVKFLAQCGVK